jgi:hypothetical protein
LGKPLPCACMSSSTTRRPPAGPRPGLGPGAGGGDKAEPLLHRKTTLGVTRYLFRWRGHMSAAD